MDELLRSFSAPLFKMGTWTLLEVRFDVRAVWGKGNHRVKGTLDEVAISGLSIMPVTDGGERMYLLPIRAEIRKALGKDEGDFVRVRIKPDRDPLEIPDDLQEALAAHPAAQAFFDKLTDGNRRLYLTWIGEAKQQTTRRTRIRKTIELLAEGRKLYEPK